MNGDADWATARIPVGASDTVALDVTEELTVGYSVEGMPMVFATPQMIHHMEVVSAALIAPQLPAGWVSVGTRVDVEHLAATPVGMQVRTTATVLEVTDRRITFEVVAHDAVDMIGRGRHQRSAVELGRFDAGVARKRNRTA